MGNKQEAYICNEDFPKFVKLPQSDVSVWSKIKNVQKIDQNDNEEEISKERLSILRNVLIEKCGSDPDLVPKIEELLFKNENYETIVAFSVFDLELDSYKRKTINELESLAEIEKSFGKFNSFVPSSDLLGWKQLVLYMQNISGSFQLDFLALDAAIEEFGSIVFYNDILPFIIVKMKDIENLFKDKKLFYLLQSVNKKVVFTKNEACVLLANAFFSTFNFYRNEDDYLTGLNQFNLEDLFNSPHAYRPVIAKILMILNYFKRMKEGKHSKLSIVFERRYRDPKKEIFVDKNKVFGKVVVFPKGSLMDAKNARHADFANMYYFFCIYVIRFIGGGTIGCGCVQEEIKFSENPECLISQLICPCLTDNEAIVIYRTEQFSKHEGYGKSLKFGGDFVDDDVENSEIVAFDAIDFRGRNTYKQWEKGLINREIIKCVVAFGGSKKKIISTGNWGCGAFKFIIQWIGTSLVDMEMMYYTFERKGETFSKEFNEFIEFVNENKLSVYDVYHELMKVFEKIKDDENTLEAVKRLYNECKNKK